MMLLALLLACHPCGPWTELQVVDKTADGAPDTVAEVEAAIAQFAEWSGREETCVQHVSVVDEVSGDFSGGYITPGRTIRVKAGTRRAVTVHELCHAVDHEEGWPSTTESSLEPYADRVDHDGYPTHDSRMREAFARICQSGPALNNVVIALDNECGELDDDHEAVAFVSSIVYPDSVDLGALTNRVSLETHSVDVPGFWRDQDAYSMSAVSAGDDLVVTDLAYDPTADPDQAFQLDLHYLDVENARVVDTLSFDPHGAGQDENGNPSMNPYRVGGGRDGALVTHLADDGHSAWRLDGPPLQLTDQPWPSEQPSRAYLYEGHALALLEHRGPVVRIDLSDGATTETPAAAETHSFDGQSAIDMHADADGAVAIYASTVGTTAVTLDPDGAWTSAWGLPFSTDRVSIVGRTADGRVALTVAVSGAEHDSVRVTLFLDPATGTWALSDGDCDAISWDDWHPHGDGMVRPVPIEHADGDHGIQLEFLDWTAR